MASFDFFTKPQLSQPPVSLFGDAAEQGVKVGGALPTPITAAITGYQKGVQTGQQMTLNEQKIASNQIILDRETKNADILTQAQAADANARIARAKYTEEEEISKINAQDAGTRRVEAATEQLNYNNSIDQQEKDFSEAWKTANTQQRWSMLNGGNYSAALAKNKALYDKSMNDLYLAPDLPEVAGPYARDWLDTITKRRNITDSYDKNKLAYAQKYQKANDALHNTGGNVDSLANAWTNGDVEKLSDSVMLFPEGSVQLDDTNSKIKLDNNQLPVFQKDPTPTGKYLAVQIDANRRIIDGTISTAKLTTEEKNAVEGHRLARNLYNGYVRDSQLKDANDEFDRKVKQLTPEAPSTAKVVQMPLKDFSDPERVVITSRVTRNEQELDAAAPSLTKLRDLAKAEANNPALEKYPVHVNEKLAEVQAATKAIIDARLKRPEFANKYSQKDVDAYNYNTGTQIKLVFGELGTSVYDWTGLFKVDTPDDLYRKLYQDSIERSILDSYEELKTTAVTRNTAGVKAAANAATRRQELSNIAGQGG